MSKFCVIHGFFYGKTTEINFSALGRYKRLGQNSHGDIPPLKQYLNITLSITDSSNIDGDQMNLWDCLLGLRDT